MKRNHEYKLTVQWTGNKGGGTKTYTGYERSHSISVEGKPEILGSSDPHFRGDKAKYNPEELLVAALSSCHMLAYLHLCADAGVVVIEYANYANGVMAETENGSGHFIEVVLNPMVTVSENSMIDQANKLHDEAHAKCFIANSCNFSVRHKPVTTSK